MSASARATAAGDAPSGSASTSSRELGEASACSSTDHRCTAAAGRGASGVSVARRGGRAGASGPTQWVIVCRTGLAAACSGVSMPAGDPLLGERVIDGQLARVCRRRASTRGCRRPTRSRLRLPGAAPQTSVHDGIDAAVRVVHGDVLDGAAGGLDRLRRSPPGVARRDRPPRRRAPHPRLLAASRAAALPALADEIPSHTTAATLRSPDDLEEERVLVSPVHAAAIADRRRDRQVELDPVAARARGAARRLGQARAALLAEHVAGRAAAPAAVRAGGSVLVLISTSLVVLGWRRSTSAIRSARLAARASELAVGALEGEAQVALDERQARAGAPGRRRAPCPPASSRSALSEQLRGQPRALLALDGQLSRASRRPRAAPASPGSPPPSAAEAADPGRLRVDVAAGGVGHALVCRQRAGAVAGLEPAAGEAERRARDRRDRSARRSRTSRAAVAPVTRRLARKPQRQLRARARPARRGRRPRSSPAPRRRARAPASAMPRYQPDSPFPRVARLDLGELRLGLVQRPSSIIAAASRRSTSTVRCGAARSCAISCGGSAAVIVAR